MTIPAEGIPEDPSFSGSEETAAAPADTARPLADGPRPSADPLGPPADANPPAETARVPAGPPVDTAAGDRWSEIQAAFVDDPRQSVTEAAGMVDDAISAFIDAARERQTLLASSWQDQGAGTEELRIALQDYRAFWSSVAEFPQPV